MQAGVHFQVFLLLLVAAVLVFISSFVSLSHHSAEHDHQQHVGGIDREKLLDLSRSTSLKNELPADHNSKVETGQSKKDNQVANNKKKDKKEENGKNNSDNKKKNPPQKKKSDTDKAPNKSNKDKKDAKGGNNKKKDKEPDASVLLPPNLIVSDYKSQAKQMDDKERCFVDIAPKCHVNRHVHYWNDRAECYVSPLRAVNGLAAKNEDRKFVVFQPDLGGWNNIRMALEVVILMAKVTGRILVLPPSAILYLLSRKKKWGENKSGMEDYFDFERLTMGEGLETMSMSDFLETVAKPGLLGLPLPGGNTNLIKAPLYEYLEKACHTRQWSPGLNYLGLNIPADNPRCSVDSVFPSCVGDFNHTDPARMLEFSLGKRVLTPYDEAFHQERAIYFPGHENNRLLTHFYSFLFFGTKAQDHAAKRFMRDRLRYHDEIFCVGSNLVERLLALQPGEDAAVAVQDRTPKYIAFHIRRGDFQQKHTRLEAEQIVELTNPLVPDRADRIAYIATDEGNRSFFAPFLREYKAVYFLDDIKNGTGVDEINPNFVGMIEQVVCAGAHAFIGTPLSTFTAYITRMRGFMNRTIEIHHDNNSENNALHRLDRRGVYERTYYFMKHHMFQLHNKPKVHFPLWIRDFVDVFQDIDDDLDYRDFRD